MITQGYRSTCFALAALWCIHQGHAQQFSIKQPSIVTCAGALEVSGGFSGEYGNNENFTTTICPDDLDGSIVMEWVVFDLSAEGTVTTRDRIEI